MSLSEADTRAKLIDPALHKRGWTEDLIRREETERGIEVIDGKPGRKGYNRTDYILRIRVNPNTQPVAVALIEAKPSDQPPVQGIEQAKRYAILNNVPFIYSSNGYLFVEYDKFTGKTSNPVSIEHFPTPDELRQRYEQGMGIRFIGKLAMPFPSHMVLFFRLKINLLLIKKLQRFLNQFATIPEFLYQIHL